MPLKTIELTKNTVFIVADRVRWSAQYVCIDTDTGKIVAAAAFETAPAAPGVAGALTLDEWAEWSEAVARDGVRIPPYGAEYFQTSHWELMREAYLTGRCAECKRHTRTELHHVTYARLGSERPEDLFELCRTCHDRRHEIRYKRAA